MATCRYRLPFQPSPSNFVESVQVEASYDGSGVYSVIAGALPSNTVQVEYEFPLDAQVSWRVRWIGDNGTEALAQGPAFQAVNMQQVQPGVPGVPEFIRFTA